MAETGLTSLVVLARDRLAYTRRCLETLAATEGQVEWIVVDNGSTDGTPAFLREWRARAGARVTIVRNATDPGASRARNQAIERTRGEFVVFLDNDVFLEDRGWLTELLGPMRRRPAVAATSPLLLFPGSPALVQCAGGGVTRRGGCALVGRGLPDGPAFAVERVQAWAPTAALAVRRAALLAAGGFDEAFDPVSICEDLDLCCRLRSTGGEIRFVGTARLRHYEGTTFNDLGYDKFAYWKRHTRVVRRRWMTTLRSGPLRDDADIAWRRVIKRYDDLEAASVRLAARGEARERDLSFFAPGPSGDRGVPDLRVGVLGCGSETVDALTSVPGTRLVGHAGAVVERLLDTVPMEAVVIGSSPAAGHAAAALRREISVLVERPDAADLDELARARARHPRLACMVNVPWALHPAVRALAELVAAGRLGRVRAASALFERRPRGHGGWPSAVVRELALHPVVALERLVGAPVRALEPVPGPGRARAEGWIGEARIAVTVGRAAPVPRFAVRIEGSKGHVALELLPWSDATAGSPYAHFLECVRARTPALTDAAAVAGAAARVLEWAAALETAAVA